MFNLLADQGKIEKRKERLRIKEEEAARDRRNHEYMTELREAGNARRKARQDADDKFCAGADVNDFEEWEEIPEPPELVRARDAVVGLKSGAHGAGPQSAHAPDQRPEGGFSAGKELVLASLQCSRRALGGKGAPF